MCGFVGFTGNIDDGDSVLTRMMDKVVHRGPDSFGKHIDNNINFGFRRLSIIGLENGNQPIYNEDKSVILVFNGEIYNYAIIKTDLQEKGHIFNTTTDSEVLVHGYEEYGVDLLNKLRGMFAFAIWDSNNSLLFMARDFFGIKPLYYTQQENNFIFSSEIKSILEFPTVKKELNISALQNYLSFQYSVPPQTFFNNIFSLPPAHYAILKDGDIEITRYWEAIFDADETLTLEQSIEQIDEVFKESIEAHKISDVEVGCFLSSGVDSSYVASCFHGDKTFTVGFDYHKYNEIDYAKELSEFIGVKHYYKLITTDEYWDSLSTVQFHLDEPLADPSCVGLYFVSKIASEHVKVVLSGEGADELFGGYNIYREPMDIAVITRLPKVIRKILGKLASLIPFDIKGKNFFIRASKNIEERFIGNANMFSIKERKKMLKGAAGVTPQSLTNPFYERVSGKDDVTKMQYLDINMWMVGDILLKADKMSMAHSLELRVPFLDKEVFRVASKLPLSHRVNKENTKYAMRMAAKKNIPENVANKKKLGFPIPIRVWLKEKKYYSIVKEAFKSDDAELYFNTDILVKFLDDHFKGKKDNSRKIWTVYMFLVWYEQYFR